MKKTSEPIVFFGSGPVAAESLELLAQAFEVEAVITKPRPMKHKGAVPVLDVAQERGLTVHTASNKAELDALFAASNLTSRLGVLVDFGIIVSQQVINFFPLGIVNSHFSLLPEWRGADPITFSILSGQKRTGVSLMLLVAAMDEGPLLAQTSLDVPPKATTPELTKELIQLSDHSLKEILPLYMAGNIVPMPQEAVTIADSNTPTYSRKLTKEDGLIDWHKPAEVIEREIRAFIEWPKSRTTLGTLEVVITEAHVVEKSGAPGQVFLDKKELLVYCGQKSLVIDRLKPAGKQEMTGQAFLAGYRSVL